MERRPILVLGLVLSRPSSGAKSDEMESLVCITGPAIAMPPIAKPKLGLKHSSESGDRCPEFILEFERGGALLIGRVARDPKAGGLTCTAGKPFAGEVWNAAGAVTGRDHPPLPFPFLTVREGSEFTVEMFSLDREWGRD